MQSRPSNRYRLILFSGVAAIAFIGGAPLMDAAYSPVFAQAEARTSSMDFHGVLGPHGRWQHHGRWGDVWGPADRPRNWRPYTRGHWAYTDDWGWYWISAEDEQDWGWVAFHYGRWIDDPFKALWPFLNGTAFGCF